MQLLLQVSMTEAFCKWFSLPLSLAIAPELGFGALPKASRLTLTPGHKALPESVDFTLGKPDKTVVK